MSDTIEMRPKDLENKEAFKTRLAAEGYTDLPDDIDNKIEKILTSGTKGSTSKTNEIMSILASMTQMVGNFDKLTRQSIQPPKRVTPISRKRYKNRSHHPGF